MRVVMDYTTNRVNLQYDKIKIRFTGFDHSSGFFLS